MSNKVEKSKIPSLVSTEHVCQVISVASSFPDAATPMDCSPLLLCPWDSPGTIYGLPFPPDDFLYTAIKP